MSKKLRALCRVDGHILAEVGYYTKKIKCSRCGKLVPNEKYERFIELWRLFGERS